MGKFKKIETSIEGVYVIEPTVFGDNKNGKIQKNRHIY